MSNGLTRGQIRREVRGYLMQSDLTAPVWTDDELNGYINEGVFYVQQLTNSFWDMDVAETVAGQEDYSIPDNQYQLVRVAFDRQFLPQTNEYELDRDTSSAWRGDPNGTPARFYLKQPNTASLYQKPNKNGPAWAATSEFGELDCFTQSDGVTIDTVNFAFSSEFGVVTQIVDTSTGQVNTLWNEPQSRFNNPEYGIVVDYLQDTSNLCFMYVAQPDTLTDDSQSPQFHETFHPAVVYYTLMRCFVRDGEFQDLELGEVWYQVFIDWMDSALQADAKGFPTMVKSAEPYGIGNILNGRLQAVGPPSQMIVIGTP